MSPPFRFRVAPRYELFYALALLADAEARIHGDWRARARAALPKGFFAEAPILWPLVADALFDAPLDLDGIGLATELRRMDPVELGLRILTNVLHDPRAAGKAMEGAPLRQVVAALPKKKREWLSHVGLFPVDAASPAVRTLNALVASPAKFARELAQRVEQFWTQVFHQTWQSLEPALEKSRAEKERLFQSCTLDEFARLALLRVEIDDRHIAAIRGGFRVSLDEVSGVWVLPSVFNDARYWSAYQRKGGLEIYFPCFDPAISLDEVPSPVEPELDPALIFRALGDETRFAIARLIARSPMTSAELAEKLGLTRPTVSHHVYLLREAGLLEETPQRGAVVLGLRRDRIAALSQLALSRLYGGGA